MLEAARLQLFAHLFGDKQQVSRGHVFTANGLIGLGDGIENLDRIKRHFRAVALYNAGEHELRSNVWAMNKKAARTKRAERPSMALL